MGADSIYDGFLGASSPIVGFLVALVLCSSVFAQPQELEVLGPDKWPTTVEATVNDILANMSQEDKDLLRQTKRKDLIMFHQDWGQGIRNYYGLWRGNKELRLSACGELCHPEEASMLIIDAVWRKLQE